MAKSRRYKLGPIAFDAESHVLRRGDEKRTLAPKASEVLEVLVEAAIESYGRPVGREFLMERIWEGEKFKDPRGIDVLVMEVRKVLDDLDPAEAAADAGRQQQQGQKTQRHIETVLKTGYKYIGPVERLPSDNIALAVREPDEREWNHFEAIGIVRDISNRLVQMSLAPACKIIVKPIVAAAYRRWRGEKRELKAKYVLNVEYRKRDELVRISVQVLRESDRSLKCSHEFECSEEGDIRDVLQDIAGWIVDCLSQGAANE